MQEERFIQLIAKDLAKEISKGEKQKLNKWLSRPENQRIYLFYEAMWRDTTLSYNSPRSEKVFDFISKNINKVNEQTSALHASRQKRASFGYFLAIAAVFVLVITSFLSLFIFSNNEGSSPSNEVVMLERTLPKGQKMKIFLPDGSIVWLNAESKLQYPERFDKHQRQVYLKGEAFFEVEADPDKPFVVHTEHLDVTALGTSFNVRDYAFETSVKVALKTGKVRVNDDHTGKQLTLNPGQGAFYNKTNGDVGKEDIDPDQFFLWKDGILYFKDASFNEVFEKLSRWYGVRFEIENYQHQQWAYTGRFKENEYLSNVLKSISYTKDFNYEIDQNNVFIKF